MMLNKWNKLIMAIMFYTLVMLTMVMLDHVGGRTVAVDTETKSQPNEKQTGTRAQAGELSSKEELPACHRLTSTSLSRGAKFPAVHPPSPHGH